MKLATDWASTTMEARESATMAERRSGSCRDDLYEEAVAKYGDSLERLARAYQQDPEASRDLLQEIHLALWRSFEGFDGRCSLRTWVYRVGHNIATSLISRRQARAPVLVGLEEMDNAAGVTYDGEQAVYRGLALDRLFELIRRLKTLDRQLILLYLDGVDAASIGEITGLSAANVATKVHRIKRLLARRFPRGATDDG